MNSFAYILILLVVRVSTKYENTNNVNKLFQLLSNGEFNVSVDHNVTSSANQPIFNFYIIPINFFNNSISCKYGSSKYPEDKEQNKSVSSTAEAKQSSFPPLNGPCEHNRDCRMVPYSECRAGKCSCSVNYLPLDGGCFALIDGACEDDSDCGVAGSSCESGNCKCKANLYSTDNKRCLQLAKGPGDYCESSQGCLRINHSSCSEYRCKCSSNYRSQENSCLGLINATCSSNQDCAVKNSSCFLNTCQCLNGFYANDTCYQYADSLNGECQSDEQCTLIPYSSCSNGRCRCLQNYDESSEKCLGMINAFCNNSTECVASNAICNGTCQCPMNFYFEDNNCYKFSERHYEPVHSAQACQQLTNTVYSGGRCACSLGYYYDNNHCHEIPSDYETPVTSAKACEYLLDAAYINGTCRLVSKHLHVSCNGNENCGVSFSECSHGKCECKDNYTEHNDVCYALVGETCNIPKDCQGIWYSCFDGICDNTYPFRRHDTNLTKPGTTASYHRKKYINTPFEYPYFTANTSHQVGDPGNLAWAKNFTLDRIVALRYYNPFTFWCRAKNTNGKFVPGKVTFTIDRLCHCDHKGDKFSTEDYEVYVDLGP